MERAAGPLRNASSGRVLESRAPGAPRDCGVPGRGPRPDPGASRGDRAGTPRPAPAPPRCPGGASLPAAPHPEEPRCPGLRPEPAGSALAAPGQPRDSARWMLCVAGAKLKVSGVRSGSPPPPAPGAPRAAGGQVGLRLAGAQGGRCSGERPASLGTAAASNPAGCGKANLTELSQPGGLVTATRDTLSQEGGR
ncbi:hypothetical protein VULLAG_LOCUS10735 [Vulpes lagopus]